MPRPSDRLAVVRSPPQPDGMAPVARHRGKRRTARSRGRCLLGSLDDVWGALAAKGSEHPVELALAIGGDGGSERLRMTERPGGWTYRR